MDLRLGTVTVPEFLEEARRNGVLVFVTIMLHVLTYIVSNSWFEIEKGDVRFVFQEV